MLCALILNVSDGNLLFDVDFERQIFEKLIMAILFCQKSAERKSSKKYFYIFLLMSELVFELGHYLKLTLHPLNLIVLYGPAMSPAYRFYRSLFLSELSK